MKCKHVQKKLLDYFEGVLDPRTQLRISEHLQQCPVCAQELRDIEQTVTLLQSVPIQEPPEAFWPDFTTNVMREVRKAEAPLTPERVFFFFPNFRLAAAAAIIIALLVGGGLYFSDDVRSLFLPGEPKVAELTEEGDSAQSDATPASEPMEAEDIEIALSRIASDELVEDILGADLALFEGGDGFMFDMGGGDETLYLLINSLTEEEKELLLQELQRMQY